MTDKNMHLYTYLALMALVTAVVAVFCFVAVPRIKNWYRLAPLRRLRSHYRQLLASFKGEDAFLEQLGRQQHLDISMHLTRVAEDLLLLESLMVHGECHRGQINSLTLDVVQRLSEVERNLKNAARADWRGRAAAWLDHLENKLKHRSESGDSVAA